MSGPTGKGVPALLDDVIDIITDKLSEPECLLISKLFDIEVAVTDRERARADRAEALFAAFLPAMERIKYGPSTEAARVLLEQQGEINDQRTRADKAESELKQLRDLANADSSKNPGAALG